MKDIIKKIVVKTIIFEARLMLLRYRPKIVAVTGSVGKTSAKDMIYEVLSVKYSVRKNQKSLNSETGLPLTILGFESGWNNPLSWLKIILFGLVRIIYVRKYPRWLVLEIGINQPGDMEQTASWIRPEIAVFTAFGEVPVHVEFFESPEDVMFEKSKLMNYVNEGGAIILNADDKNVLKLKTKSNRKVYTYGINSPADLTASHCNVIYDDEGKNKLPSGISFKLNYDGNVFPIKIEGVIGEQYIYPVMISILVGTALGISPVEASESLTDFKPAPGRMNLIKGKNNSMIIDDSYNSSPLAVRKALEAFKDLKKNHLKIAVLGDMLEIGKYSYEEHQKIGEIVAKNKIDHLVTIGFRAETIAEFALKFGMKSDKVKMFKISETSIDFIKELQEKKEGSLILVKGSQGVRTEKIIKEIMEEPEKAKSLLVRQENEWLSR